MALAACGESHPPSHQHAPPFVGNDSIPRILPASRVDPVSHPRLELKREVILKTHELGLPSLFFKFVSLGPDSIYICDYFNHRVVEFDRNGNFIRYFGEKLPKKMQRKKHLRWDILYNRRSDQIYLIELGTGILRFQSDGTWMDLFDLPHLRQAEHLQASSNGDLLTMQGYVRGPHGAIARNGEFLTFFYSLRKHLRPRREEYRPNLTPRIYIDTDSSGNIFAGTRTGYEIRKYDADGNYLGDFSVQSDQYYVSPPPGVAPGTKDQWMNNRNTFFRWLETWTQTENIVTLKDKYVVVCLATHNPRKYRLHFYTLEGAPALEQTFWDYRLVGVDANDDIFFANSNSDGTSSKLFVYTLEN